MPGFLKLFQCRCLLGSVCVFVCMSSPRLLISSGVIWTSYDWLNKFYSRYMATVVVIVNVCGLGIVALVSVTDTNPLRVS